MEEQFIEFLKARGTTIEKEREKELNEFMKRLEERKKEYNASGRGIDFNKPRTDDVHPELELERFHMNRSSHKKTEVAYIDFSFGADIEAEQVFQKELHEIVDDMKVKLVDEKKILEGTHVPEYGSFGWPMLHIERTISENELSHSNLTEEQWKSDSQNGFSTTDPIPISTHDSSSSSSTAEESNPSFPTIPLRRLSTSSLEGSWEEKLVVSGNVIDAMSASFESMEQTINVPMAGMLNEEK
jgi:hypothetical protein